MSAPLPAHDLLSLRRHLHRSPPLRLQFQMHRHRKSSKFLIRSMSEDRFAVTEKEAESYGLNGNGSGRGLGLGYEVMEKGWNGRVEVLLNGNGAENASLVKFEEGNGAAKTTEEKRRKKRVEEIEKEDA